MYCNMQKILCQLQAIDLFNFNVSLNLSEKKKEAINMLNINILKQSSTEFLKRENIEGQSFQLTQYSFLAEIGGEILFGKNQDVQQGKQGWPYLKLEDICDLFYSKVR